jgi:hypothetical protein
MANKFLFIGEKRSDLAIKMNVRWEDGRLAAKQLFDALFFCGINPKHCKFINLFEPLRDQGICYDSHLFWINALSVNQFIPVAMGNKVSKQLNKMGVKHIKIVHPAAKGLIRKKENYINHVKDKLPIS